MDPLSVAAGAVGVATAGIRLVAGLYSIADRFESAHEDIGAVASDLNFLTIVVDELGKVLGVPSSQCIASDRLLKGIKDISEKCQDLFRQINRMTSKLRVRRRRNLRVEFAGFFEQGK